MFENKESTIINHQEQEMGSKQPISLPDKKKSIMSKIYSFPWHDFYFILLCLNPFKEFVGEKGTHLVIILFYLKPEILSILAFNFQSNS